VLISATNRFLTEPLRERWGLEVNLSTEPASSAGRLSGQVRGTPSFGSGKVDNLQRWIKAQSRAFGAIHFYSDSYNDLPLLNWVDHPVAVDPDPRLKKRAQALGWPVISLRPSAES
jgi:phosphoserine phosphatase